MAIDIGLIFTALKVAKSVAEFAGILDSIEAKVDRLVQSELNAGMRTLEQAARAAAEQAPLLREARGCFNKAVNLEMGYRRVVALLGLSLCHHWLDDKPNCARALEEILEIDPVTTLNLTIAGLKEISGSTLNLAIAGLKEAKSFALLRRMKQIKQEIKQMQQDKLSDIVDRALGQHPIMLKYGKLMFSDRARKEYKRELVLDAVDMSKEATAIRCVQESISRHVGKPVSWLKALE